MRMFLSKGIRKIEFESWQSTITKTLLMWVEVSLVIYEVLGN